VRYAALRRGSRPGGWTHRWPVTRPGDYPAGYVGAARAAARAAGYFYLNRGWRRSGCLLSHLRAGWTPTGWVVRVWYLDRRRKSRPLRRRRRPRRVRRRPRRRWRGRRPRWAVRTRRTGWIRRHRRTAWPATLAGVTPPDRWIWVRLRGVRLGNADTIAAHVGYRLRGRHARRIRGVALPILRLTQKIPGVVGARVRCAGRFTRRQRADRAVHRWGRVGRADRTVRVEDRGVSTALRFGRVGVTVTVAYAGG
jgi:hypothetical protein